ncbi:MAG TPA: hypothetical protein VJH37_01855 [Candidatus Nanoarchaeia archaeon]|nr:hypothetical protein [Candidatus Nanoarchaeia archaeon]
MGDEKKTEVYAIGSAKSFIVVKYAGIFDILELLGAIKTGFAKRYYTVAGKEHSEAVKSSGKELVFEFEGMRKVTEYVLFKIVIKINILRLIDVVVGSSEGKEKKQQAEVDINVKSWIGKNYKNTFKNKSKIQEFLRQVYERFIGKTQLDDLKRKLIVETLSLIDDMKAVMSMPRK